LNKERRGKLFPLPFGERDRVRGIQIHRGFIHIFPIVLATLLEKTQIEELILNTSDAKL